MAGQNEPNLSVTVDTLIARTWDLHNDVRRLLLGVQTDLASLEVYAREQAGDLAATQPESAQSYRDMANRIGAILR